MNEHPALAEYLRRERDANAKPEGADHNAILAAVAQEHGVDPSELREMVLDEANMGPC